MIQIKDSPVTEDELSIVLSGLIRKNVFPEWLKPAAAPPEVPPEAPPGPEIPPEAPPEEEEGEKETPKESMLPLVALAVGALLLLGRR